MIHKTIHYDISPNCDIQFESSGDRDHVINAAITEFVAIAGKPNANDYATLEIDDPSTSNRLAGILAKPRAYTPPRYDGEECIGWAVAIINPNEYDYICELPEDEIDNALVNILRLEGNEARYWTKRYASLYT